MRKWHWHRFVMAGLGLAWWSFGAAVPSTRPLVPDGPGDPPVASKLPQGKKWALVWSDG